MLCAVFGFTFVIVPPHPEPGLGDIKMNSGIVEQMEKKKGLVAEMISTIKLLFNSRMKYFNL